MLASFQDAARTYRFVPEDEASLASLSVSLTPHVRRIAAELAPALPADDRVEGWVARTLAGPWPDAYAIGVQLARTCAESGVPSQHVCIAFAAMRRCCLELVATHAPTTPLAAIGALDRILDLQLAAWLQCYQSTAAQCRHAALQALSSGLAHEVRNPLNSARLQLELLERRLRKAGTSAELSEPITSVRHEIDRLGALVKEFIAFAQPTALALAEVDTAEVVAHGIDAERELAQTRGVTIALATRPVRASLDKAKIQQVVQHLVRNAIEASPPGSTVVVANDADDKAVRFTVTDSGAGISDAVVRRIYEPFFSTKEGGTGLGMAIVQSLVALHGGSIAIETSPRGTRIDVTLPAER